jgi:hypothetical protein
MFSAIAPDTGARQTARPIAFCQDGVLEHDHRRATVEKPVSPEGLDVPRELVCFGVAIGAGGLSSGKW